LFELPALNLLGDLSYAPQLLLIITGQIFAILNPISVLPTFLSITDDMEPDERHRIVRNSSITVLIITITLAIGGNFILSLFSVGIPGLQIGGGILLMVIAAEMLGGLPRTKSLDSSDEIAVVPIATPLLVGPGTMTTIIVLSATVPILVLISSVLIVTILTYVIMRYSEILVKVLGSNGTRALGRFMTIIIAAFAAQLIYAGLGEWFRSWGFIT